MRAIAVRLAQVVACLGGAVALSISLAACGCPPPKQLDQVFLLDATAGTPVIASDAGSSPPAIDCTPAASGCVPGGDCLPACNCVLARDQADLILAIDSCKLLAGAASPQVEVRYELHVACPPY